MYYNTALATTVKTQEAKRSFDIFVLLSFYMENLS